MKKIISIFLSTVMLLCAVLPMSVSANSPEGEKTEYYDNLVGYWNFDGADPLVNKGTAETLGGNLTVTDTNAEDEFTTTFDGKANIPYQAGNCLGVSINQGTALDTATSMTIGFKIKIDSPSQTSGSTYLIYRADCYSLQFIRIASGGVETGYKLRYAAEGPTNVAGCWADICGAKIFEYGTEYYVFFSVSRRDATKCRVSSYFSTIENGVPSAFSTVANKDLTITSASAEDSTLADDGIFQSMTKKLWIGKSGDRAGNAFSDIHFDDLWIFDTALDGKAIANVATGNVNNTTTATSEVPTYRGCQVSAVNSGKFSTRFIATIDSLEYYEVGFKIQVTDYNGQSGEVVTYDTKTVYSSVVGSYNNKILSYSAAELGGKYVYALYVDNIYTNYAVTFKVTPYYITAEGGEATLCTPYIVTVNNGAVVSQTVAE